MDNDAFQQAVQHAGVAALVVSFLTGFFFSFNPVALAAIPVSLAYVTKHARRARHWSLAACSSPAWCSRTYCLVR